MSPLTCPQGAFCPAGAVAPVPCPAGQTTAAGGGGAGAAGNCSECEAGRVGIAGVCRPVRDVLLDLRLMIHTDMSSCVGGRSETCWWS